MSDLWIWFIVIATLNNAATIGFSYIKSKFAKWRIRKHDYFTYASSEPFYGGSTKKLQMRRYYYLNGSFYTLIAVLVSSSILNFVLAMTLLLVQYVALYQFYLKQYPTFYVYEKGISCQALLHPMDRDHVGKLKWDKIELMDFELPENVRNQIPRTS